MPGFLGIERISQGPWQALGESRPALLESTLASMTSG